jgi:hypothetical protein
MKSLLRPLVFLAMALIVASSSAQTDTTFTYQGSLLDGGSPANGSYNLDFTLWNASAGGLQVGSAVMVNSLPITDGKFAVQLDFGSSAFIDSSDRWIEISVNGTEIAPRQPVTRAPFAIQTRGLAVDAFEHVGIGTETPQSDLHIQGNQTTIRLDDLNNTDSFTELTDVTDSQFKLTKTALTSAVFLDINPVPLDGTSPALARIFRDTNTVGEKALRLYRGDGSATPSASIGVDGFDSYFQRHGGNVGIGTITPDARLHAITSSASDPALRGTVTSGSSGFSAGVWGESTVVTGDGSGVQGRAASAGANAITAYNTSGDSGRGYGLFARSDALGGVGVFGWNANGSGTGSGVRGDASSPSGYDFYASGAGINYGAPSSIRWKNNIQPIKNPLEMLSQIRAVYYDWDEEHGGQRDIGFIGEEVGEVLPEIVSYEQDGEFVTGMDYGRMTPLLVEAVNKLNTMHEAEITRKNAQITELSERITRLESMIEQSAATQKQKATR